MSNLDIEKSSLFDYEFERLAVGLSLLRNKISEFEFLDSRLIKLNDNTFDNINRKNNEKLKQYITTNEQYLLDIRDDLVKVYENDLHFKTIENYLINNKGDQSKFSKKFIYHQVISLILEADDYVKTKDIKSLSGNYIYLFQKCFYDKNKFPEEFGEGY